MDIRIHDVVANTRVVDADSLLTPAVLARIVQAVLAAQVAQRQDDRARQRDTRVGDGEGECGCQGGGEM